MKATLNYTALKTYQLSQHVWIWDSHNGGAEDSGLLGCDTG